MNFFWLFFFIPFSLFTVTTYYGLSGVLLYNLGIWLLLVINNYWYQLCRLLISENLFWILLPLIFYAGLALLIFLPDESPVGYFFRAFGDYLIEGKLWVFLLVILCIALLFLVNRFVVNKLIYSETSKSQDTTKLFSISSSPWGNWRVYAFVTKVAATQ
mgnify:FL=1